MPNKCTLLIDGNWLLISRFSVMKDMFDADHTEGELQQATENLKDMMARSINLTINRIPCVDNIIFISDGGSWRKQLPIPKQLEVTYKGNREEEKKHSNVSWNYVFRALNDMVKLCETAGITTNHSFNIEGDDWVWYWSRRLNANKTNCIIWTSDNDLKQLVQDDNGVFTAWYNDQKGGKIFFHDSLKIEDPEPGDIEVFMQPIKYHSNLMESIIKRAGKDNYIDPNTIINGKVICGDSGDNIKSVVRVEKGGRIYGVGPKDWEKISNTLNIKTIQDLENDKTSIAKMILNINKFKNSRISVEDVCEMIDYNIKLVWLNESVIPEPVISIMNQQEYKQIDIEYFRSSYRTLLDGDSDEIENIFNDIDSPF